MSKDWWISSSSTFGHLTRKKTVPEYVHDEAVLRMVKAPGIDFAQGDAVSRPRPLSDLLGD